MRLGRRPSLRGQGCCLLVVRSVHNKMMCPADGHQNDDKKGTSQKEGKDKEPKTDSRPQHGGGVSFNKFCLFFLRDSRMRSHTIS